jgi:hypothetical protein
MTKKKPAPKFPIHKMGQHCGYDELENGDIVIAPTYADQLDRLSAQQNGIDTMLRAVAKFAAEASAQISNQRRQVWVELSKDYGLTTGDSYEFSPNTRVVRRVKQPAAPNRGEQA